MYHYQHHIGDFNNATRHLNRIERSLYRDLIELYYDSEKPLPNDLSWICRKIVANEHSTDVERLLAEFFIKSAEGWLHARCEKELDKYRNSTTQKALAGKASAEKRKERMQQMLNARSTDVQQTSNERSTNQEPRTNNQEPITDNQDNTLSCPSDTPEVDSEKPVDRIPYSTIFDLFEEICVSLPKTRIRDDARKSLIKKVWKMDELHQDVEFFKWLFNKVESSDFLSGRSGKYKNCGFDWILKPANFKKIVEGNYDNR